MTDRQGLPCESSASAEARRRASRDWLTAEALMAPMPGGAQLASLRDANILFGVWCPELQAYLYPPWQLDHDGLPLSLLPRILALLRGSEGVSAGGPTSGWEEIEWFLAPHALLGRRTPADEMVRSSAKVLQAAQADFAEGVAETRW